MYNNLLRLYKLGRLSDAALTNAVNKGWITEEQKQTIMASRNQENS